jgi:hypothetical protein
MMRARTRILWLLLAILAVPALPATAQDDDRIPAVAADIRGTLPRFKADPAIALAAGVAAANLPTRGLGLVAGVHWYPLHVKKVTVGIGGELLASRGSRTLEPASASAPAGPTARTRFSAISPQLSLNFGGRDGWSYLSGGLGSSRVSVDREDQPLMQSPPRTKTINYGGGARWFTNKHLAFSVDLRFYAISPQDPTATTPVLPRMRLIVVSAGVGFR